MRAKTKYPSGWNQRTVLPALMTTDLRIFAFPRWRASSGGEDSR